jgi:hypothetical protein
VDVYDPRRQRDWCCCCRLCCHRPGQPSPNGQHPRRLGPGCAGVAGSNRSRRQLLPRRGANFQTGVADLTPVNPFPHPASTTPQSRLGCLAPVGATLHGACRSCKDSRVLLSVRAPCAWSGLTAGGLDLEVALVRESARNLAPVRLYRLLRLHHGRRGLARQCRPQSRVDLLGGFLLHPGITCAYASSVIPVEACPGLSETTLV